MLQLIECLPSVRATGFLTTPLLDCHWLVIEASPKTNGCSKKSIHLQVAFLERTNVTNVCVWNEKKNQVICMTLKPEMFYCQIQTWSKGREGPSSASTALIRVIPQVVEGRSTRVEVSPSLVVLDEGFHAGFRSHDWCWIWERNLNPSNFCFLSEQYLIECI